MSSVPNSGVISFGNMRSILGKSTGVVRMSDVRQTQANVPFSGTLRAAHFKGMGSIKGIFQTFRDDTQAACTGIYSVRLVNTSYTGPVLNIMRMSDNTIADFWTDYNGNLRTGQGQTYTDWLGTSATAFVMIWYDQSGYGRDAIGTTQCGAIPPQLSLDPTALSTKYSVQYINRYDPIIVISPYYVYPAYNSSGASAPSLLPTAGYVAFAPGAVLSNNAACQYMNFGSVTFNMTSGFSCCFTFMPRLIGGSERVFDFGSGIANGTIVFYRANVSNSFIFEAFNGGTSVVSVPLNTTFALNRIYHVTIVYNPSVGSTGRVDAYVNGTLVASSTPSAALTNRTNTNTWVGRSNWTTTDGASNMNLYSLHAWNKVLSPAEIAERAAAASYLTMQTQLIYIHPHLTSPSYNSTGGTAPTFNTTSGQIEFFPGNVASNNATARIMNFGSQTFNLGSTGFSAVFAFQLRGAALNNWERIIDFGNGAPGNNIFIGRYTNTNTFVFTVYESTTSYDCITTNFPFMQNTLYEIACVYDPNVGTTGCMYIYVDGILRQSLVPAVKFTNRTLSNTYVGRSNWAPDIAFNGVIHFLHVYNRALTPAEVWNASRICDVIPYSGFNILPAVIDQTLCLSWRGAYGPNVVNSSNGTPPVLDTVNRWFVFNPGNNIASNTSACQYYDFGSVWFPCASQGFTIVIEFMYTLLSNTGNGWDRIFDFGSGANADNILLSREGLTSNMLFAVRNGGTVINPSNMYITTSLAINTWYKVVLVYNPTVTATGTLFAYLNDSLVTSQSLTTQLANRLASRNFIGRSNFDSDASFNGNIRTFQWWNRVLTPAEFTTASASAMLSYRMRDNLTAVNSTRSHDIISSLGNVGLRTTNNQIVSNGGANDFMNGAAGFGYNNATYSGSSPFATVTLNSWNTLCASRNSGTTIFNQIGFMPPLAYAVAVTGAFNGYMNDILTFNTALPTIAPAVGTSSPDYVLFMKNPHIPFWRNGLYGAFFAENWQGSGTTYPWLDMSGMGQHVSTTSGTINAITTSPTDVVGGAGTSILTGTTTSTMTFPTSILPSTYTILHVTRYNSSTNRGRIYTLLNSPTNTINWLSGHHGGRSGVAHHNGWITALTDFHGNAWVLSTDQNALYRSLSYNRTTAAPGTPSFAAGIGINNVTGELSDWAAACLLVYNRTLSLTEYLILEDYLANRYRIPMPIQEGLVLSLDASDYVSGSSIWNDRSGNGYNFTVNSTDYVNAQVPYFNFLANIARNGVSTFTDVPFARYNTVIAFTAPQTSNAFYRTLFRGANNDHHVAIPNGTNNLGMYDNNTNTFIPFDRNVDITTLPNAFTRLNMWVFIISQVPPYYTFYYNPSSLPLTPTGVIESNANAAINNGFAYVGGAWVAPSNLGSSQPWGAIGTFLWYHRRLSEQEIVETYWRYQAKYATGVVQSSMQVCYAMRVKVETYTGPIVRVRRSTDNATQDFFSDETQTFLTTSPYNTGMSYDDWITGGATGFVTIWYDQSGNNNNLTNSANNTTQPTLSKQNSKWVIAFNNAQSTVLNYTTGIQPNTLLCHFWNSGTDLPTITASTQEFSLRLWQGTTYTGNPLGPAFDWYDTMSGTRLGYVNGVSSTTLSLNTWTYLALSASTISYPRGALATVGSAPVPSAYPGTRFLTGFMSEFIAHNTALQVQDLQNYFSSRMFLMNPLTKPRYGLISRAAASTARGIYACWRVQENYTGPIMTIRRSSDNTIANFYDDGNGSLVTATGIHISRWLGTATAFVAIWHDQSSLERHATQNTNTNQPIYNANTKNIIFDGVNDFFALPNDTIPSGNTSYTVMARHDFIDTSQLGAFISAGTNMTNQSFILAISNVGGVGYQHVWWNNDLNSGVYVKGNVVTARYDNTVGRTTFVNGIQTGTLAGTLRATLSTNNNIGVISYQGSSWLRGELKCVYVFSSALSDTDRSIIENANVWMPYSTFLYAPPNYYGMSLYLDASRTESYPGSGTTWTDLSGCGNNLTLTNCTFVNNNAIRFDGSTSFAFRSLYNQTPTTAMTLIAWVNVRGNYTGMLSTLNRDPVSFSNSFSWSIDMFWDFGSGHGFQVTLVKPQLSISTPGWYQLCFAKSPSSQGTFYLNGRANGTYVPYSNVSYGNNNFCIGKNNGANDLFFNGDIAMFMVYNYDMSAIEIQQNFNDNQSRFLTTTPPVTPVALLSQLTSTSVTSLRAAYTFRLVNDRYTGFCMRVRRSTDNVEQDFYADTLGNLTTGPLNTGQTLASWLGGANAFMTTWYDQSGRGFNLTQTSQGTQPQVFQTSGDDTYIHLSGQRGLVATNVFATSTISDMHAIFGSRTMSQTENFLINFNGTAGAGAGARIFVHAPWGPVDLWYWAPGDGVNTASASSITSLRQRVSVSIYKSTSENRAGLRLNQGTRYLSGTNPANIGVTGGMTINGIPTGTAGADHYFYGLYVFDTRLTPQDESLMETSLMPFTNQPSGLIRSGLVCWLDFSVTQSYPGFGRSIFDLSGLGNNFSIIGSGFSWNPLGYLTLTTAATSATGPASSAFNIQSDHTVEIVCRPTNNTNFLILLNSTTNNRMISLNLPWSDNNLYYDAMNNDTGVNRVNYLVSTSTVKHYVLRCRMNNTPNREVFENGTSVINSGTARTVIGSTSWGGSSTLFAADTAGSSQWLGNFYYIRIYNRALTNAEITTNYNVARARFGF